MSWVLLDIDWGVFSQKWGDVKLSDYMLFAVIILLTILLKKPLAAWLTRLSTRIGSRYGYMQHRDKIREILFKPVERLLQIILYFIATEQIAPLLASVSIHRAGSIKKGMNINLATVTDHLFLLIFILFLTQVVTRVMDFLYYIRMGKADEEHNLSNQQMLPLIKEISKLITWTLSAFWILGSVFHVNVPALITGLGIGGVAIALAGKETVENFFAAFTILSDKPFQTGDTIKLGEIEATVERIGFRSTRLRNLDGSAYIIPNQNLVSQNLINLSNRSTHGLKIVANIKYGMSHESLNHMIEEIKSALHDMALIKEPVTVSLDNFEKETFQLVVSYHVPHPLPEGTTVAHIKHKVNARVFEIVNNHGQMGTAVGTS